MSKRPRYRSSYFGFDVDKLKLIGQGHEGKVYLLPNDKVLKIFHNPNSCKRQIEILTKARDSKFFPTVFDFNDYSIIMSLVYSSTLFYYLKQNKIYKHLALKNIPIHLLVLFLFRDTGMQITMKDRQVIGMNSIYSIVPK